MNTEPQKFEKSELHEKLQSGQLVIGLSSAIPGFVKKQPTHNIISFAPFFARDRWVDFPVAIVQELTPASNGMYKEHLPLSIALKPEGRKEKILMEIIGAMAHSAPGQINKTAKTNGPSSLDISESGICRQCQMGDECCVDCYLAL